MSQLTPLRRFLQRILPSFATVLVLGVWGCAGIWQPVNGRLDRSAWSVEAPEGWMRLTTPAYDMLSKDGPYLQYILIQDRPLAKGFQFTRQVLGGDMLPHEMAQVIIDNLRADPQIRDFELLESGPAMVAGQMGFKLIYTYQDRQGVDMQTIYYGTTQAATFYNLRYTATRRHYFAADRNTFEQVVHSLVLSSGS